MKKSITLLVVLMLVFAMTVPALAETIDQDTASGEGSSVLTYTVTSTYTVTIPAATETISGATKDLTVTISNTSFVIPYGQKLSVAVSSDNYANSSWNLVDKSNVANKLAYTITKNSADVANNGEVVSRAADSTAEADTATLTLTPAAAKFAGTYEDTLTFTASLKAA